VAIHFRSSGADAVTTADDCEALCGAPCEVFRADLSEEIDANALVPRVVRDMGRLDAVVNSASSFQLDHANDLSHESLDLHMHANAAAPVLLARALADHVAYRANQNADAEGCVVNLLDQKLWNQNPDFFSYTLSKAALEAANTMLALALAPRVRVVGVAPGLTLTSHMLSDDKFQNLHKLGPLGRGSHADDVAATVLFALQTRSITGTTLMVSAGQHLQRFERDFSLM
jgi:NAD(P)-dependent dehydrogenase (short-subunit alcohol dehydrogenase family)